MVFPLLPYTNLPMASLALFSSFTFSSPVDPFFIYIPNYNRNKVQLILKYALPFPVPFQRYLGIDLLHVLLSPPQVHLPIKLAQTDTQLDEGYSTIKESELNTYHTDKLKVTFCIDDCLENDGLLSYPTSVTSTRTGDNKENKLQIKLQREMTQHYRHLVSIILPILLLLKACRISDALCAYASTCGNMCMYF